MSKIKPNKSREGLYAFLRMNSVQFGAEKFFFIFLVQRSFRAADGLCEGASEKSARLKYPIQKIIITWVIKTHLCYKMKRSN